MRDPDRIDKLIHDFTVIWKRFPDMRFGQLYMNLTRGYWNGVDVWNVEDDKLEEGIIYFKRHGNFPTLGSAAAAKLTKELLDSSLRVVKLEERKATDEAAPE